MTKSAASLDLIQIASPCHVSWEDMKGDDRTRFCGQCKLHVYNLSEMPHDQAEALIARREGRTCVRFFRRQDGTVLTRDCPMGLRAIRQRLARSVAALAALLLAMLSATAFGSRINRLLPDALQSPRNALANWIDPSHSSHFMGDVAVMGAMLPPQQQAPVSGGGSSPQQ